MGKFEVGQRVKVNYRGWEGEGVIHSISDHKGWLNVDMQTGNYAKVQGAFSLNEVEPIVTFQPGDIVRAEKGYRALEDQIVDYNGDSGLLLGNKTLDEYEQKGYTLTLVKRPEPEIVLPTKQGMYFATEHKKEQDEKWHSDGKIFFYLNSDGNWIDLGWGQPSVIDGELKAHENE